MSLSDQLLLLFSGFGSLYGFSLAAYVLFRPPADWGNRFLAALIAVLSLRILKSVLFYFNPTIARHVLQLGLSACLLIGPLLYCYVQRYRGRSVSDWHLHLHWLLPLIALLVVGWVYPYQTFPGLWRGVLYQLINAIWLIYNLSALLLILPGMRQLSRANWRQHVADLIVFVIVVACGVIWATYFFATYTSYISGALVFTFLTLLGALLGTLTSAWFRQAQTKPQVLPYADKKIEADEAQVLAYELEQLMVAQQVYLDANLALPRLAKMLGCSAPKLSQFLNDNLSKSFNDYVNGYRIDYAKHLLQSEEVLKMDVLAERSGFNSLSTFYTAFKKHTQLTPAKFKATQI